ncbi:MAG: 50S ribosomal protein L21 [bacterium]|nr:50S ribosomal protein L21 [bacterium]
MKTKTEIKPKKLKKEEKPKEKEIKPCLPDKRAEGDNFAIIETGGKQYLVRPGDKLRVERITKLGEETAISFDKVLLMSKDGEVSIGQPYIQGAKITAEWLDEKKGKKVTMMRYKSKTRRHRKKGHRQIYTSVAIGEF